MAEAEAQLARARSQLADLKLGKRPEEIARLEANLAEAKAALAYAEQDLERQASLARRDFAAEARLDQARSAADEARAQVAAMEADLATARLPARDDQIAALRPRSHGRGEPGSGALGAGAADGAVAHWPPWSRTASATAGEWVDAGGIVVSLLPPGKVKVRFFVPEPALGGVRVGQPSSCAATAAPPA